MHASLATPRGLPRARPTRLAVATLAVVLVSAAAAGAQPLGLTVVRLQDGLTKPVFVAAPAGDPRIFIVEEPGTIRILDGDQLLATPFLDIRDRVLDEDAIGENGLLSVAFAPDYSETGHFYVYYTASDESAASGHASLVSRFTAIGDPAAAQAADPGSEFVLLHVLQPGGRHNGGTIALRDGWLYLGLGDGTTGGGGDPFEYAQDDAVPFGKLLRLDLTALDGDPTDDWEIWAKGLRNPFRFSFDRVTGDLYLGDVGESHREEIDVERGDAPGGANFGWDVMEGSLCFSAPDPGEPACGDPSLTLPTFEYDHLVAPLPPGIVCTGSVTGGAVYRGAASPALRGLYFFGDWCQDRIWSMRWNRDTGAAEVVERTAEIVPDAGKVSRLSAIAEGGDGELYLVDRLGEVFRLVPEPGALRAGALAAATLTLLRRRRSAHSPRAGDQ